MIGLRALLVRLRSGEVMLMVGFPLTGVIWAAPPPSQASLIRIGLFAAGIFLLFEAIYCFNSWFGYADDRNNPRLAGSTTAPRRWFLAWGLLLGTAGTAMLLWLAAWQALMIGASLLLWTSYALPRTGLKERPPAGTVVHFVSQAIHFHMGSLLFAPFSPGMALASLYFSLLFAAGHLHHEAIDFPADRLAGVTTGAVRFGRGRVAAASVGLFGMAAGLWLGLALAGIIPPREALPFLAAFGLQAGLLWRLRRKLSETGPLLRLRTACRLLYLAGGAGWALARLT